MVMPLMLQHMVFIFLSLFVLLENLVMSVTLMIEIQLYSLNVLNRDAGIIDLVIHFLDSYTRLLTL